MRSAAPLCLVLRPSISTDSDDENSTKFTGSVRIARMRKSSGFDDNVAI